MGEHPENYFNIVISIVEQRLYLLDGDNIEKIYMIASAKNGIGQIEGSECTPLGQHHVVEKIGDNAPVNAVFIGRQWQGEIYSDELAQSSPDRDWILTRILWLSGLEQGKNAGRFDGKENRGVSCDTKSRYIYIHGCPNSHAMQIPSSHGCIKMRNTDVMELFELTNVNTAVNIIAETMSQHLMVHKSS